MPMIPDTHLRMIDACVTDIVQQTYRIPVANHELVKAMVASILLSRRPFCGGGIRHQLAGADPVKQEPTEHTHA